MLFSLVSLSFLFITSGLANLDRPVLFSDGLSPHVDPTFWEYMTPTRSTLEYLESGWIPKRCLEEANDLNFNGLDMEAFTVQYADCDSPWIFCRHRLAPTTAASMVDVFGRLPVHERQWVQHLVAVPANGKRNSTGGIAYMSAAVVVIQEDAGTPSVLQHETGHAIDAHKVGPESSKIEDYSDVTASSDTSTYKDAIEEDSCVPDDYSNSSEAEAYTQIGVLSMFDILNPGGLDVIGADWHCLKKTKEGPRTKST